MVYSIVSALMVGSGYSNKSPDDMGAHIYGNYSFNSSYNLPIDDKVFMVVSST